MENRWQNSGGDHEAANASLNLNSSSVSNSNSNGKWPAASGRKLSTSSASNKSSSRNHALGKTIESKPEEPGQVHHIIGHFGKYQLLIFLFKIFIGLTSAFNNLSVTFFAPSGFVSFWCLDNSDALLNLNFTELIIMQPVLNSSSSNLITLLNSTGNLGNDFRLTDLNLSKLNNSIARSKKGDGVDYKNLFQDFILGQERKLMRLNDFSTDTPGELHKECTYYSELDQKRHACKKFRYDTGFWLSTIIDEWDLVCNRSWFVSMTQSLYMSGFIVSFLVFGYVSDRFGRWKSLLIGAVIEVSSGFGCALAPSVTVFMLFRFILGLGNAGRTSSSYLIMIEWVGPRWRMHVSTLGILGWIMGYCLMPWISLYFMNFRHMQLFVCFYELIFVICLLRIPESPRWLLTHKRFDEAYKVLLMAAKFNGLIKRDEGRELNKGEQNKMKMKTKCDCSLALDLTSETQLTNGAKTSQGNGNEKGSEEEEKKFLLEPFTIEQFNSKFEHLISTIDSKAFTKNENKLSPLDLMRWSNLRKYALILYFVWASNSFIYYGIVLRIGDFGGKNLFKTFTIAGLTEIPSMIFTIIFMKFLPRRATHLFLFITTGLLCFIQIPLKYYQFQWLQQSTILLAKLFNSCSFTVILYQTMELFPTSIRQTAYSSCSLAGRIGSILAPFIKELAQATNDSVPPIIYSLISAIAALLIVNLPETKGLDLPDTLLEAEQMGTNNNKVQSEPIATKVAQSSREKK